MKQEELTKIQERDAIPDLVAMESDAESEMMKKPLQVNRTKLLNRARSLISSLKTEDNCFSQGKSDL